MIASDRRGARLVSLRRAPPSCTIKYTLLRLDSRLTDAVVHSMRHDDLTRDERRARTVNLLKWRSDVGRWFSKWLWRHVERHRQRPRWQRIVLNVAWFVLVFGAVYVWTTMWDCQIC